MRTLLTAILLLDAAAAVADVRVRHAFSAIAPRGEVTRVIIDIPAGDITVRNGASDRLTVTGYASREPHRSRDRAEQQRIVDDIAAEIYVSRQEAVIRRRFGAEAKGFSGETFTSFEVLVEVPPGMDVDVNTRFGEVDIEGRFGDIDVDLRAGEIDLRIPRNDVRELRASCRVGEVRTNLGHEIVERAGLFPGRTRFVNPDGKSYVTVHTTAGEVDVRLLP